MLLTLFRRWLDSERTVLGLVALYTASMLAVGWMLQYAVGLVPCPLCIIQRFFFGAVGLVALIGACHGRLSRLYAGSMFALATLGGLVAGRNVYIEWVPQGLDAQCIPWLESVTDWVAVLFQATGDCAKRDWTLIGLSIPEWSLFSFLFLMAVSGWMLFRWRNPNSSQSTPHA